MSDEVASKFVSLKTLRIRIMTRMEAMRADGMPCDNRELRANMADTVRLARTLGRRRTDRGDPIYQDHAAPQHLGSDRQGMVRTVSSSRTRSG